ncbi:MAG TPA: hypothetical protein VJP85_08275 [Candidatus Baltobacteraceae bacterium]|nr:hypothetical protein [Candidatus Baltobacteraceae bacterium]
MQRSIFAPCLLLSLAFAAGCGGSGSTSGAVPSGAVPIPFTGGVRSAPAPSSFHITKKPAPQAPLGGIVIGADNAVYLNAGSAFMRYSGTFTQYPYPNTADETFTGAGGPASLADGPNASVWGIQIVDFTSANFGNGAFAAIDTASHNVTEVLENATAPNGDFFGSLASGPNDTMWLAHVELNGGFTAGWADVYNASDALLGQFDSTGCTSPCKYYAPFSAMVLGTDHMMYVATQPGGESLGDDQPHPSVIYRVNPTTRTVIGTTALPSGSSVSQLTSGPDAAVWFTDSGLNKIGRITAAGTVSYFAVPTANSGLSGIAAGSDNALWFTETSANKIGRIGTDGTITEYAIGDANAHPQGITAGPLGGCVPQTIYFTTASGLGILTFSP